MPEEERRISIAWAIPAVLLLAIGGGMALALALSEAARPAPPEVYTCPICGATFATEEELNYHIQTAHPEVPPGLANLYGKVTDAVTGEAIPSVLVALNGLEVYTDAGGNYAFTDLGTGTYSLFFQKGGYEEIEMGDITLQEGNNELNVQMPPVVVLANLYGVVTDAETGYPLAGVKVTLGALVVYTNGSGYYGFEGLIPGSYTITFEKEGYETEIR